MKKLKLFITEIMYCPALVDIGTPMHITTKQTNSRSISGFILLPLYLIFQV